MSVMTEVSHNVLVSILTFFGVVILIGIILFLFWKFVLIHIDFKEIIANVFKKMLTG